MVATQPKISLSLDAADTTIMHRVGMTGLYMTLKRLEKQYPSCRQRGGHISWVLTADTIELCWQGSDFVALSWLIKESFQLDDTGLIHLARKSIFIRECVLFFCVIISFTKRES